MKNGAFVVWMLGYPTTSILTDLLSFYLKGEGDYSNMDKFIGLSMFFIIWGYVGWLLYENPS